MLTRIWEVFLFLFSLSHFSQRTSFVQKLEVWGAASPVGVTSHIRERGGEVDEPGEAADEINAHEGILDGTAAVSTGLDPPGPRSWALSRGRRGEGGSMRGHHEGFSPC